MIRKLATGLTVVLIAIIFGTILAAVPAVRAQESSAQDASPQPAQSQSSQSQSQQQPDNQPSTQEAPEESTSRRRTRRHDYKNWTFNIGAGGNLPSGTTRTFVRGGGGVAAAGVARNFSKYFGFRADIQFDNLPLRASTLFEFAQAPGATDHVYSVMIDPIFNIPATKNWSGYFLVGPSYYHRSGKLDSSQAVPGTACSPFWVWWGACYAGSLRNDGKFLRSSQNEFGENFGVGIARKIRPKMDVYLEFRYLHGSHNGNTTDLRPITIGVRW